MARSNLSKFSKIAKETDQSPTLDVTKEVVIEREDLPYTKHEMAMKIVNQNVLLSTGLGFIPVPFLHLVTIVSLQIKTIHDLAELYNIPFVKQKTKSIVISLISGLGALFIGEQLSASLLRAVPVLGPILSLSAIPAASGALTYAIGRLFIMHFEAGGTILNFDPKEVHEYFRKMYAEGQNYAKQNA